MCVCSSVVRVCVSVSPFPVPLAPQPYDRRRVPPVDPYDVTLYLDCCGLVRQALDDLQVCVAVCVCV